MGKHEKKVVHRVKARTIRTIIQAGLGLAAMAPVIYEAAAQESPELATGGAALGLAVSAGVTRVMAHPLVEAWLQEYVPWLAAEARDNDPKDLP